MPFVMEDEQYMEDLFNDSETIAISASQPTLKGFGQRLDELQTRGCCQKIGWSTIGCVASIAQNGRNVRLHNYTRNPSDGRWSLDEEVTLAMPPLNEDAQLVHLSWGPIGQDLAVLDSFGRIMIFTNRFAIGRMQLSRPPMNDAEDELGSIVGMIWLPIFPHQQKSRINWSATRNGQSWELRTTDHHLTAPHNCLENKAALICLTRLGVIRLLFQQPDGRWDETSTELDNLQSAEGTFTHAAFTLHDHSLLLAAYEVSGKLHLYRIRVKWVPPSRQQGPEQPKPMQTPSLEVVCLGVEDNLLPCEPSSNGIELGSTSGPKAAIPAQLTHLDFLKPARDSNDEMSAATVFAVFSHAPTLMSSLDQSHAHQSPTSIVCRWEVEETHTNSLHPSLAQLPSSKKKTPQEMETLVRLTRLDDVFFGAAILSLASFAYNTIIALHLSDGTIDFRNTLSMQTLAADHDVDKVSSLFQAGFAFNLQSSVLHLALSANFCVAASMTSDMVVNTKLLEYMHGSLAEDEQNPRYEAAMAALTLQHTSSCNQYFSGDDIFAIVPQDMPVGKYYYLRSGFKAHMVRSHEVSRHPHSDSICITIGRNPALVKCLSAQNTLGMIANGRRKLPSNLAWATLNVRYASIVILTVMNFHRTKQQQQHPQPGQTASQSSVQPLRPDIANGLVGVAKWMMDVFMYICDEMITLSGHFRDAELKTTSLHEIMNKSSSPALLMLLCSLPRTLFRDWIRGLPWMQKSSETYFGNEKFGLEIRNAVHGILNVFSNRSQLIRMLEQIVNEIDSSVQDAYDEAGIKEAERHVLEKDMFINAEIPEVLIPAVKKLLMKTFQGEGGLMDKMNMADIIFRDYSWLGLTDSRRSQEYDKANLVDVLRKVPIPVRKGVQVKRCTRGCAYTEDLLPNVAVKVAGPWYLGMSKSCVCGNGWTSVDCPVSITSNT